MEINKNVEEDGVIFMSIKDKENAIEDQNKDKKNDEDVTILAIESSCDETAAAVVRNGREVLSNIISSQIALHTIYGGVVPEIASRKHVEKMNGCIRAALSGVEFYSNSSNPEVIMKNMALACIRNTVVNYTVDDVITTAKGQIQAEVKEKLQNELTNSNIGMMVVNLSVQDAEPPTEEIVQAFKSVETAKQGKDTAVNNAKKYQSEELPKAEADADKIVQDAEAYKQARIAEAEGQVARFNEMYEQYKLQPYITKKRLFYETMEEVLPDLKVIITDGNTQQMLPLDNFNGND